MATKMHSVRARVGLGLGVGMTVIATALVVGAPAGAAAAGHSAAPIKSGAGPGWPKTLQPSDFVARVDNPWFPLKPGSRWHYRGVEEDGRFIDNMRVTHRTKRIKGVRTTVVHDVVLKHGKPREVTNDWYAQDRHGNVWYFGENTKELNRHGHVTSREGSFKAGRDGARPGVLFSRATRGSALKAARSTTRATPRITSRSSTATRSVSVPYVSSRPRGADQGVDAARAGRRRAQVLRARRRRRQARSRSRGRQERLRWSPSTAADPSAEGGLTSPRRFGYESG